MYLLQVVLSFMIEDLINPDLKKNFFIFCFQPNPVRVQKPDRIGIGCNIKGNSS